MKHQDPHCFLIQKTPISPLSCPLRVNKRPEDNFSVHFLLEAKGKQMLGLGFWMLALGFGASSKLTFLVGKLKMNGMRRMARHRR